MSISLILKEANCNRISSAVSMTKKQKRHGVEAAKTGEESCAQRLPMVEC